jgi:hypothetical protein
MTIAISTPIIIWMSYQTLVIMMALIAASKQKTWIQWMALAATIGFGGLTTTLLLSSFLWTFLLVEMTVWALGLTDFVLRELVRPPTGPDEPTDTGWRVAVGVSLRIALALGVWLSL